MASTHWDRPDEKTADSDIAFSFELFPPKTAEGWLALDRTVDRLSALGPKYFSVTYGAGGTTRDRTRGAVDRIAARSGLPVAHHLTCVSASRAEVDEQARQLWAHGIRKIVALRGDPPEDDPDPWRADGYSCAAELVEGLLKIAPFDISVGAYPEVHPDSPSAEADMDNLKRKLDAGANTAITQFVFDTDVILRFVDRARAAGIDAPIVPGIMPVSHFGSLKRFAGKCSATIPGWMQARFEGLDEAPDKRFAAAVDVAAEQCRRLADAGLKEFHIYTLNKAAISEVLCRELGIARESTARRMARGDAA